MLKKIERAHKMIAAFSKFSFSFKRFSFFISRSAHNDMKVPDFSFYRRNKCPGKSQNENENRKVTSKLAAYSAYAGLYLGSLYSAKALVGQFVGSMAPSADVLAMASIEVNLADIPEGVNGTFKWRGKPLFVLHRMAEDIEREKAVSISTLRDPAHDQDRCERPEWLIVIGICTHLGCVPIAHSGDFGGYYCPCHGSHFDAAGRARKGPAPRNLEIPPYRFEGEDKLIVGSN